MATAFLQIARAFVKSEMGPQARVTCAPFLAAGAACLDAVLSELRAQEAQSWKSQTGERDEP
jgi:hypothetical protein